jgi:hypothetical protein
MYKHPRNCHAAFAWRRSRVRVSSGPLLKTLILQGKYAVRKEASDESRGFLLQPEMKLNCAPNKVL